MLLYVVVVRGSRKKPYLTAQQFVKFLNDEQRDPRLNEILYPYYDTEKAQAIIDHFEQNLHMAVKGRGVDRQHGVLGNGVQLSIVYIRHAKFGEHKTGSLLHTNFSEYFILSDIFIKKSR